MQKTSRIELQLSIIRDLGYELQPDACVMDLGCGNGAAVRAYKDKGYRAFGCDFKFREGADVAPLKDAGAIRLIDAEPYRMPFDDDTFDLVISDQVFEHVQDYPQTLAEIKRVLKPGGVSMHFFPSRYKLVEPHVNIPLATFLQNYGWLRLWTGLGIRNEHQRGLSAKDAAQRSFEYLRSHTNYLSKAEIRQFVTCFFSRIHFAEKYFLKHRRPGKPAGLIGSLPILPALYGTFRGRVLVFSDRN